MRGFLWCHGDMSKGKAKVSWEVVCLPKNEGGLGVRRLDTFNKALMVPHIWNLLARKDTLWPLANIISCRDIHRAGFSLCSKVNDAIRDGAWVWPEEWLSKYPSLISVAALFFRMRWISWNGITQWVWLSIFLFVRCGRLFGPGLMWLTSIMSSGSQIVFQVTLFIDGLIAKTKMKTQDVCGLGILESVAVYTS
ncbi:hypothetical protein Tco_0497570 [Tanacetum coccineum]